MSQMSLKAAVKSVERKVEGKVTVENTREESLADLSTQSRPHKNVSPQGLLLNHNHLGISWSPHC